MLSKLEAYFQLFGDKKDERGVPKVETGVSNLAQLPLAGLIFLLFAIGCVVAPRIMMQYMKENPKRLFSGMITPLMLLLVPLLLSFTAWCFRFYFRSRKWWSTQKTCGQLGISATELQRLIETHSIQPQYHIDGQDYYDPSDFRDMATLLRASSQPAATPETLLRPACTTETPSEQLLRATQRE